MFTLTSITQLVALTLSFGNWHNDPVEGWTTDVNYTDSINLSNNDYYTLEGADNTLLEFNNIYSYVDNALGGVYTYLATEPLSAIVDDTDFVNNRITMSITCVQGTGINMVSTTWKMSFYFEYSQSNHYWYARIDGENFHNTLECNLSIIPFVVCFSDSGTLPQTPSIYWGREFLGFTSASSFIQTSNFVFPDLGNLYFGCRFSFVNEDFSTVEEGLSLAFDNGYNEGYGKAEEELSIEYENKLADAVSEAAQQAYSQGYSDGTNPEYDSLLPIIFTGVLDIALLPVNVFLGMLNFELFGINIGGFVSSLLTLTIVIMLIKVITGKNGADKE